LKKKNDKNQSNERGIEEESTKANEESENNANDLGEAVQLHKFEACF